MNNPTDCNCEHVHCSSPTCRSNFVSRGAVPESERVYPSSQGRAEQCFERKFKGLDYSRIGRKELAVDVAIAYAAAETERRDKQWREWGVVEVAVRNPQVADYCAHWEGRTEKAESERDRLRKALEFCRTICFYIGNLSHRAWEDKNNLVGLCERIEEYAKGGKEKAEAALQGDSQGGEG